MTRQVPRRHGVALHTQEFGTWKCSDFWELPHLDIVANEAGVEIALITSFGWSDRRAWSRTIRRQRLLDRLRRAAGVSQEQLDREYDAHVLDCIDIACQVIRKDLDRKAADRAAAERSILAALDDEATS